MPFVQGQLRRTAVEIRFESECGHCGRTLHIEIDSDLRHRVAEAADPLVYVPLVDFARVKDLSIVDSF